MNNQKFGNSDYEKKQKPSEKQITYIVNLSKTVGLKVNIENITDKKAASHLIDKLKAMQTQVMGTGNGNGHSDKKAAFGLATKLVYRRYSEEGKDPLTSNRFWRDVISFYKLYNQTLQEFIKPEAKFESANNHR